MTVGLGIEHQTLVEGKCSHHYANPDPLMYVVYFILIAI